MPQSIHLLIIDPQNSFCKVVDPAKQQEIHDGELCVPGAWEDMERVAALINRLGKKLDDIHVTMDSHHLLHIAHPIWFRDSKGNEPGPFTLMREENGQIIGTAFDANGQPYDLPDPFTTKRPTFLKWTLEYLRGLSASGRYPHCIWPPHCLIGTPGHNIVAPLEDALLNWCVETHAYVDFVTKGSNFRVEHFSAVQAEYPDPEDPTTQLNSDFISTVMEADIILLAGEASSHCLANTVRDMANSFGDDSFISKCVLLTDGTSPVPNFENLADDFVKEMTGRGMKQATCADFLAV